MPNGKPKLPKDPLDRAITSRERGIAAMQARRKRVMDAAQRSAWISTIESLRSVCFSKRLGAVRSRGKGDAMTIYRVNVGDEEYPGERWEILGRAKSAAEAEAKALKAAARLAERLAKGEPKRRLYVSSLAVMGDLEF